MRIGKTIDFLGPDDNSSMYWIDVDLKKIHKNLEINSHIFIYEKGNDTKIRLGTGARFGIEKEIKDFTVLFHGGLSLVPNGGDIPGLAQSSIYGTLRTGIRYQPWKIGIFIDHISSPFHNGKDGDIGKTLLLFEKEF